MPPSSSYTRTDQYDASFVVGVFDEYELLFGQSFSFAFTVTHQNTLHVSLRPNNCCLQFPPHKTFAKWIKKKQKNSTCYIYVYSLAVIFFPTFAGAFLSTLPPPIGKWNNVKTLGVCITFLACLCAEQRKWDLFQSVTGDQPTGYLQHITPRTAVAVTNDRGPNCSSLQMTPTKSRRISVQVRASPQCVTKSLSAASLNWHGCTLNLVNYKKKKKKRLKLFTQLV